MPRHVRHSRFGSHHHRRKLIIGAAAATSVLALAVGAVTREDGSGVGEHITVVPGRIDEARAAQVAPAAAASAASTTISYTTSNELFLNPERGGQVDVSIAGASDMSGVRAQGLTIARAYVELKAYRNSTLPASFLSSLDAGFASARKAGIKIIPRFRYGAGGEPDAPLSRVLEHIKQLGPVLKRNQDVILVIQAGFIGNWGEWHSSTNGLAAPEPKRQVGEALIREFPGYIQFRYPADIIRVHPQVLTLNDAFSGTVKSRTAHHNDCFLANDDDAGTWIPRHTGDMSDRTKMKDYIGQMTALTPMGGEVCEVTPERHRTDCKTAISELSWFHYSFLHAWWYEPVFDRWKAEGCYTEIQRRLGHRLRLTTADLPTTGSRGGALAGTLRFVNDGFAAPTSRRAVELVLRPTAGGQAIRLPLNADTRYWGVNYTHVLSFNVQIPSSAPAGQYALYVGLRDSAPALRTRPEYAIRLANQGVWDAMSGDNSLRHSVRVN